MDVSAPDTRWLDAQMAVIGAALIEPRLVPRLLSETEESDYTGQYQSIYQAMAALQRDNRPTDAVTVRDALGKPYGPVLSEIMTHTPTAASIDGWIAVCREQARLSTIQRLAGAMTAAPSLDSVRQLLQEANAAAVEKTRARIYSGAECVQALWDALNADEKPSYTRWGIACLDKTLRTAPGDFNIIAGYRSSGKSALMLQLADEISKDKRVGILSFETSARKWTSRLMAYKGQIPLRHIQDMQLDEDEYRRFATAADLVSRRGDMLQFEQAAGMTTDDIRAQIQERGWQVIFIDYLQKIRPAKSRGDLYQDITIISSDLQSMAQGLGVEINALCQLSRPQNVPTTGAVTPLPRLSSLRGSGQIEQDADAVILVHRPLEGNRPPDKYMPDDICSRFRLLSVAKNRDGELANYYLDFDGSRQTFREPSTSLADVYDRILRSGKGGKDRPTQTIIGPAEPVTKDNPFTQEQLPL